MIISKKIETKISHLNIKHYVNLGYSVICNDSIIIPVEHLPKESNKKILVKCDICDNLKEISYQKYNKNVSTHNFYTCSNKCSVVKVKITNKEKYDDSDYVNTDKLKETVKRKYDIITNNIENIGFILCSKCNTKNNLDNFTKNINGRYKSICKSCMCIKNSENRRIRIKNNPVLEYKKNKEYRTKNIHQIYWRGVLRGYLLRKGIRKNDSTLNLLGYTSEELRHHLESKFEYDMNWENYGKLWQIDHIIPVSLFKSDTPVSIANSLINLRPLYTTINLSRKAKLDKDGFLLFEKFKTFIKNDYIY
jgi:hypothetical protein